MPSGWFIRIVSTGRRVGSVPWTNRRKGRGHVTEMPGHVPETVGHDAETPVTFFRNPHQDVTQPKRSGALVV